MLVLAAPAAATCIGKSDEKTGKSVDGSNGGHRLIPY